MKPPKGSFRPKVRRIATFHQLAPKVARFTVRKFDGSRLSEDQPKLSTGDKSSGGLIRRTEVRETNASGDDKWSRFNHNR
jgi:hypothetical protein